MLGRLGNVIYWVCSGIALIIVGAGILSLAMTGLSVMGETAGYVIVAALFWGFGIGVRYVFGS